MSAGTVSLLGRAAAVVLAGCAGTDVKRHVAQQLIWSWDAASLLIDHGPLRSISGPNSSSGSTSVWSQLQHLGAAVAPMAQLLLNMWELPGNSVMTGTQLVMVIQQLQLVVAAADAAKWSPQPGSVRRSFLAKVRYGQWSGGAVL
jgi:hypothetical protein